jgi:hypothetical protein
MPGPARYYPSNAARQRAYRQRQREANEAERDLAEATTTYAYALQDAVKAALKAGKDDGLAEKVAREDPRDTLRALIDHFYDVAGTPPTGRPWLDAEHGAGDMTMR